MPEAFIHSFIVNRQGAKVAKINNIDVFACGKVTTGQLGVLGAFYEKASQGPPHGGTAFSGQRDVLLLSALFDG